MKGGGDMLALISGDGDIEIIRTFPEGEMPASFCLPGHQKPSSISCLVEGVPEVFDDVICQPSDAMWDRLKYYLQLPKVCFRVVLYDHSARLSIYECLDLGIQIRELLICPRDEILGALKTLFRSHQ